MEGRTNKTTLPNGIRILTHQMAAVRSVSMGVWINAGARDESLAEGGLSHLIEHMIFKGTRRRSAFQIAKEFDAIGGQTNAFTTMENTCYHARVMDTHVETMVEILSDILLNSVFDQNELVRELPVILQEIGMVEDTPDEYVHQLLGENYWGDHPLGRSILGTRENLAGFDAESVKGFFRRFYRPEQIVIALAGNLEHQRLVDLLAPVFASVQPGQGFPERTPPQRKAQVTAHHRDLEQTHICLGTDGLSVSDPQRYTFALMNTLLGGNMSSRLFQEIREKRGLAYSVYSFISSFVDTGLFGVYLAVDPKRAIEATRIVLQEIEKLKTNPVDAADLQGAKEFTKGNLLLAAESSDNQMVRLAQNEIHFQTHIALQSVVTSIEAVTADDIAQLAAELCGQRRMALTLLGPNAKTAPYRDLLYG